ncbi:MAG: choline dehydrogenase [Pseudonocardia sp. SCN 72-86]|nr:MAG: choline dehydrogenase [Pseudonocardia sp. SCN 72-86]
MTEYDVVVVGAGSAGCAVAARLSEDADVSVALVEAGPADEGRLFEIPGLFAAQQKTAFDWDLQTEPEPFLDDRRRYLPRGRVLGGTSSMNTMVYVRGHAGDYDEWAALGATGWSWADVLPWFRHSEDNERGADAHHGVGGPLRVSDARSVHPLLTAWVDAAAEAGHARNGDFNGARQDGVGVYQFTQRDGLRASSARAFVHPALGRPNLTVLTSMHAQRIVVEGGRARGVVVDRLGATTTLTARAEVVVCAGAYLSPQLLLLSGIGPADDLAASGIPSVVDLPGVGANLQDHPGCFLSLPTHTPDLGGADTPANEKRLREHGDGPLTWSEAGGFLRTHPGVDRPDVQFHAAPGIFHEEGLGRAFDHALSFGPYVNRPVSRGRVTLRSWVPSAKPRITHNYLACEEDRVVLRDGLRLALEIAGQPALAGHLKPYGAAADAGLVPTGGSDAELDAYARRSVFSFYHPSGTCAIGDVVDAELRVLGVDALRVADTSVMPRLVGGNTNAPAIMIGERAAAFVRG